MVESILIYSLLCLLMTGCGMVAANRTKRYVAGSGKYETDGTFFTPEMIVILLSFAFVFGCRWAVGRDYFRYLYAFTKDVPERYEFLFQQTTVFLQDIGVHFSVYFGLWALMEVFLLYYAARRFKFIFPYIAFFLIFGSQYLSMMNAIRQHIAAGIFLVSVTYIDTKQPLKYFLSCIIAVLFHKLSFLLFVMYPILRFNNDWFKSIKLQLLIYMFAVVLSFYSDNLIRWIEIPFTWLADTLDYTRYKYEFLDQERFDRSRFGNNTGLGIYMNILRTVPIILLSGKLKEFYKSTHFNIFYTLFFVSIIGGLVFGNSIILNRINIFFVEFQILIYSFFFYFCFYNTKLSFTLLGVMISFIFFVLFLNIVSNPMSTAQYSFFWEH